MRFRLAMHVAPSMIAAATFVATAAALAAPPAHERQQSLFYLLRQDCGSCHGLTLKGGLGPPLLPGALKNKDSEALVEVILDGVPGTPMPPWRFEISDGEAAWLVEQLKQGLAR